VFSQSPFSGALKSDKTPQNQQVLQVAGFCTIGYVAPKTGQTRQIAD